MGKEGGLETCFCIIVAFPMITHNDKSQEDEPPHTHTHTRRNEKAVCCYCVR